MIEIRICPECGKAFYKPEEAVEVACPHCTFFFLDRRGGERVHCELDLSYYAGRQKGIAVLKDYSDYGARIMYEGRALAVDDEVSVDIGRLGVRARGRAVWTERVSGKRALSGLKFSKRLKVGG